MRKGKSKAISEEKGVGLDGPKHLPLSEATIEANLGGRFLFETPDGQQWDGTIRGRSSRVEGHWEAFDHNESLRIVSTNEVVGLKNTTATDPSIATRPDDGTAGQAGAASQGDNTPLADSDAAAMTGTTPPNGQDAADAPESAGHECSQHGNIDDDLPDESWELPALASFIACRLRRTAEDAWWIGYALDIARYKHITKRRWLKWLTTIGFSKSSAYRYMGLCEMYTLNDIRTRPGVGVCKLLDEFRAEVEDDDADDAEGAADEEIDAVAEDEEADNVAANDDGGGRDQSSGQDAQAFNDGDGSGDNINPDAAPETPEDATGSAAADDQQEQNVPDLAGPGNLPGVLRQFAAQIRAKDWQQAPTETHCALRDALDELIAVAQRARKSLETDK